MSTRQHTSRRAFTLLETLAASAIAVTLFVVALRLASAFREGSAAADSPTGSAVLHALLARDLGQSISHEVRDDELRIFTVASFDDDDLTQPALVVYHHTDLFGRRWLLRSVRSLTASDVVWSTSLLIERLAIEPTPFSLSAAAEALAPDRLESEDNEMASGADG